MICSTGRPEEQPDPKKPADSARRSRGLDRESGDRIKGCDGTWIHALGSLAGAHGWNITNVAALPISRPIYALLRCNCPAWTGDSTCEFSVWYNLIFNMNCG